MGNIVFMPEYAQMLKKVEEESRLKALINRAGCDMDFLNSLSSDDLKKMARWLVNEVAKKRCILFKEQTELNPLEYRMQQFCALSSVKERVIMSMDIFGLDISIRVCHCLRRGGISTIGELCSKSRRELSCLQGFRDRFVDEIEDSLLVFGLILKGEEHQRMAEHKEEAVLDLQAEYGE